MVNLFEIARQAQSGAGFDALARPLGLDQTQVQRALEGLLPAFTLAFQRSAAHPAAFADLLSSIGSGRYAPFYDPASLGGPSQAASGTAILNQLFRTPEVTQQVAAQTAAMTGIGAQVVHQMMPHVAAMLIGGISRYATAEGFADLLRQWADALKDASRNAPSTSSIQQPKSVDPWTAWTQMAQAMMGMPEPAPSPPRPAAPGNPFEAWTAAMASLVGGGTSAQPAPPPARKDPNPYEMLSRMFETGREVQQQHLASMKTILDGAWGTSKPAPILP